MKIRYAFMLSGVLLFVQCNLGSLQERNDSVIENTSSKVPPAYKALYTAMERGLTDLDSALDKKQTTGHSPMTFAAEALIANGNRGEELVTGEAIQGAVLELDRFQKLGIQGVTIAIPYPLLVPGFKDQTKYLDFYKKYSAEVKRRKMKMDVEMGVVFSGTDFSGLSIDFSDLTLGQYVKEYQSMAQLIIDAISPDYLNLGSEPDTFAKLIGIKEFKDPEFYAQMIDSIMSGLKKRNTLIGAGASSWLPIEHVQPLAELGKLDFLSIHIYPLSKSILDNISQTISLGKKYEKRIVVDEAWMYKAGLGEAVTDVAATSKIFKRDFYSFWAPLDQKFLDVVVKIAQMGGVEYISPFWSRNFFTYLEYSPEVDRLSYPEILKIYNQQLLNDMVGGNLSGTGEYYRKLISENH